jgi:hypothetical protein
MIVQRATHFDAAQFKTTFENFVLNQVSSSACLLFWYGSLAQASKALESGLVSTVQFTSRKAWVDPKSEPGLVLTCHQPHEVDDDDMALFPVREAVLAVMVPKALLATLPDSELHGGRSGRDSALRKFPGKVLLALRGAYFGDLGDPEPWVHGLVHLPPHRIARAYRLVENIETPAAVSGAQDNFAVTLESTKPFVDPNFEKVRKVFVSGISTRKDQIVEPRTCREFLNHMRDIRKMCAQQGWAMLYHYTQPFLGPMIATTGFRMSTQGQGDGGIYFSTLGPAAYDWGSSAYEENIITDCK